MLVRSNQLRILYDFYKYAQHINVLLTKEYVGRASEELLIIGSRFRDLGRTESGIVESVLSTDRFVVAVERGAKVINIHRPAKPKKVSPRSSLTLALSIVLGGMVGVFFILVRNAIKKRKERLARS